MFTGVGSVDVYPLWSNFLYSFLYFQRSGRVIRGKYCCVLSVIQVLYGISVYSSTHNSRIVLLILTIARSSLYIGPVHMNGIGS